MGGGGGKEVGWVDRREGFKLVLEHRKASNEKV